MAPRPRPSHRGLHGVSRVRAQWTVRLAWRWHRAACRSVQGDLHVRRERTPPEQECATLRGEVELCRARHPFPTAPSSKRAQRSRRAARASYLPQGLPYELPSGSLQEVQHADATRPCALECVCAPAALATATSFATAAVAAGVAEGATATKEGEAAEVAAAAGFAPLRRVHRRADSVPREAQPLVRLVGEPPEQGEGGSNLLPTQATFGRRRRQVLSALMLCPGPRVCR